MHPYEIASISGWLFCLIIMYTHLLATLSKRRKKKRNTRFHDFHLDHHHSLRPNLNHHACNRAAPSTTASLDHPLLHCSTTTPMKPQVWKPPCEPHHIGGAVVGQVIEISHTAHRPSFTLSGNNAHSIIAQVAL